MPTIRANLPSMPLALSVITDHKKTKKFLIIRNSTISIAAAISTTTIRNIKPRITNNGLPSGIKLLIAQEVNKNPSAQSGFSALRKPNIGFCSIGMYIVSSIVTINFLKKRTGMFLFYLPLPSFLRIAFTRPITTVGLTLRAALYCAIEKG